MVALGSLGANVWKSLGNTHQNLEQVLQNSSQNNQLLNCKIEVVLFDNFVFELFFI